MVLSEAVEGYLADRVGRGEIGERTARAQRNRLLAVVRFVGDVAPEHLGPGEVAAWQRSVLSLRPGSRKVMFGTLQRFCRWLLDEGLIDADPTRKMGRVRQPVPVPRALSVHQLARLGSVLSDDRARCIVALQSRLGLRCVEVENLSATDWDRATHTLLVRGKFGNERRLPVPGDVAAALERHLEGRPVGAVIGWNAHKISRQVSGWMDKSGIKTAAKDGISAHALRHTAASDLYDRTKDVRLTQTLLGHQSVATTDRYLRRTNVDALRAALG